MTHLAIADLAITFGARELRRVSIFETKTILNVARVAMARGLVPLAVCVGLLSPAGIPGREGSDHG
jgi:hypothetical protein